MNRILHLSWLPEPGRWPGIAAKLRQMAQVAAEAGLPLTVAACTAGDEVGGGVVSLPLAGGRLTALRRGARLGQAIATLAPDATVLRWPGALDPSLAGLVRHHGPQLISEHHTNEPAELRRLGGAWYGLRAVAEERLAGRLLARLAGTIAVTPEIRDSLAARARLRRSCVIANGIDIASVPASGFRRWDGGQLELVWACGRFSPWHGLDRLAAGLAVSPLPITVHLLGDAPPGLGPAFVRHGILRDAAAEAVYARAHLAVGSLALHRAGLSQACPLKVREYLARGLPFLAAHEDPDVPGDAPWACRLPDGDGAIDIGRISAFAERCRALDPAQLRQEADRLMGWRSKLERLCAFAAEAVGA